MSAKDNIVNEVAREGTETFTTMVRITVAFPPNMPPHHQMTVAVANITEYFMRAGMSAESAKKVLAYNLSFIDEDQQRNDLGPSIHDR